MTAHAGRHRAHRHVVPGPLHLDDDHSVGEEALHFTRWFMQSKYKLMGEFLGELQSASEERDPEALRGRYCRALQHAQRVQRARGIVTVLLALGVLATAASAVANLLDVGDGAASTTAFLERAAALSASIAVALVALRLALDRYLERVDIVATFLAIQLSCAAVLRASPRTPPAAPA
jgi:hypothetical protein